MDIAKTLEELKDLRAVAMFAATRQGETRKDYHLGRAEAYHHASKLLVDSSPTIVAEPLILIVDFLLPDVAVPMTMVLDVGKLPHGGVRDAIIMAFETGHEAVMYLSVWTPDAMATMAKSTPRLPTKVHGRVTVRSV